MTIFKLTPQTGPQALRAEMIAKGMNPDAAFLTVGFDHWANVWVMAQG